MSHLKNKQGGWVFRWAIVIFAIILLLSYFGFNIEKFMNSDSTTSNLGYISRLIIEVWVNYITPLYDKIAEIIAPFSQELLNLLTRMGHGGSVNIQ